jgi:pimeloyl-ACP methyl ester carboxylesterase
VKAAVEHVQRGRLGAFVDPNQIALWGTSMAGGHVLKVAKELGPSAGIKCVISQVPHLDGKAASKRGLKQRGVLGTALVMGLALADYVRSGLLGLSPVYVKIVGTEKEAAYMMLGDAELKTYFSKHPVVYLGGWRNLAPARTLAVMSMYSPIQDVPLISEEIPILFVGAKQDALCPVELVREAARISNNAQLLEVDSTHFDVYAGDAFSTAVAEMRTFLKANLCGGGGC